MAVHFDIDQKAAKLLDSRRMVSVIEILFKLLMNNVTQITICYKFPSSIWLANIPWAEAVKVISFPWVVDIINVGN